MPVTRIDPGSDYKINERVFGAKPVAVAGWVELRVRPGTWWVGGAGGRACGNWAWVYGGHEGLVRSSTIEGWKGGCGWWLGSRAKDPSVPGPGTDVLAPLSLDQRFGVVGFRGFWTLGLLVVSSGWEQPELEVQLLAEKSAAKEEKERERGGNLPMQHVLRHHATPFEGRSCDDQLWLMAMVKVDARCGTKADYLLQGKVDREIWLEGKTRGDKYLQMAYNRTERKETQDTCVLLAAGREMEGIKHLRFTRLKGL
ncbi:hypothetical protein BY996DRAFT_6593131 [Phakopsora pachyrhizi]|nr:hypothetical protein BY996DRAFT_6593131 [Phakopsora pachyrhizi]